MKRHLLAFTLIELLVVIAVIAVLMGTLMPALSRAREQGKRAVCLAHVKPLGLSWILYADENNQKIVNACTVTNTEENFRSVWCSPIQIFGQGSHLQLPQPWFLV